MLSKLSIKWSGIICLFAILKHFGIGEKFMALLKMLCVCPRSAVLTNSDKYIQFQLHGGNRQGLEPLAISIRMNPLITGIMLGASESLIGLCLDDIVLTLSSIQTSCLLFRQEILLDSVWPMLMCYST